MIDAVFVAYGASFSSNPPLVNGTRATVGVWADPDQDGNPSDAVLLASVPTTIQNANTGIKNQVDLPFPVPVQGKFFVGALTSCVGGQEPAVVTGSGTGGWSHSGRAWLVGSLGAPLDLGCLGCNNLPPVSLAELLWYEGQFLLSARSGGSGLPYCFGDGTGAACPCGNPGEAGEGCAHSKGHGALLWSTGTPRVFADDLVLRAVELPVGGGIGLFYMGSQTAGGGLGLPFMDGLRCAGGQVVRFPAQKASSHHDHLEQRLLVSGSGGLIQPGTTWNFQSWFRDPTGPCGTGANLSNALAVTFTP